MDLRSKAPEPPRMLKKVNQRRREKGPDNEIARSNRVRSGEASPDTAGGVRRPVPVEPHARCCRRRHPRAFLRAAGAGRGRPPREQEGEEQHRERGR